METFLDFVIGKWWLGLILVWSVTSLIGLLRADARLFQGAGFFAALFGLLAGATLGGEVAEHVNVSKKQFANLTKQEAELQHLRLKAEIGELSATVLEAEINNSARFVSLFEELRSELGISESMTSSELRMVRSDISSAKHELEKHLSSLEDHKAQIDERLAKIKDQNESALNLVSESKGLGTRLRVFELLLVTLGALQGSFGYAIIKDSKGRSHA